MTVMLQPLAGLDLLRERRREVGVPDPRQAAQTQRQQQRQGMVWAGLLLAGVAGLGVLLTLRHQLVLVELERVSLVETKLAELQANLESARGRLTKTQAENKALAKALVGTRSGSALLRQLQLLVPQGVQLREVNATGNDALTIVGASRDPQSFARLNALQLQLQASPLLDPSAVKLTKAERQPSDDKDPDLAGKVRFEISAKFSDAMPLVEEALVLRELGADGLARRLQLLERERLLQ